MRHKKRGPDQRLDRHRKTIAGVAARLKREAVVDRAEALLKQAATVLKQAELEDMIDFPAFPRVREMAFGFDLPKRANLMLVKLSDYGVPREVLVAAAVEAGLAAGGEAARTNLKNRIASTRRLIANSVSGLRADRDRAQFLERIGQPPGTAWVPTPEDVAAELEKEIRADLEDAGVDVAEHLGADTRSVERASRMIPDRTVRVAVRIRIIRPRRNRIDDSCRRWPNAS